MYQYAYIDNAQFFYIMNKILKKYFYRILFICIGENMQSFNLKVQAKLSE